VSVFLSKHFRIAVEMSKHSCWQEGALVQPAQDTRARKIGWKCSKCGCEWMLRVPEEATKNGFGILHGVMSGAVIVESEQSA
jgi:hypothetical protein